MEGFGPETLAWLAEHPSWDPRIRLAPAAARNQIAAQIARDSAKPFAGHPIGSVDNTLIGDDEFDGLIGRTSQINGMCLAAEGMSFDLALMKMSLSMLEADEKDDDKADDDESRLTTDKKLMTRKKS